MSSARAADPAGQDAPHASASAARYDEVRAASERLCEPLSPEDCALQSMPDASPAKWHLAHTSWFFETFVLAERVGYQPFDPRFRYLFNSYYNTVGEQYPRSQRGLISRPGLREVLAYRAHVDAAMRSVLSASAAEIAFLLDLGLQHEQQHQELILTDLKHLLAQNPLAPAYLEKPGPPSPPARALRWQEFDAGIYGLGHEGSDFAFDNEGPRHRVLLEKFELASRPATNAEWLSFMEDRGYERAELWLSDGWDSVRREGWRAPLYWREGNAGWQSFTLAGLRDVCPHEPVCHLSFYEADAFARWSGARLPSEAEWELAAQSASPLGHFADAGALHPRAPTSVPESGLEQMFGDVWEWTQSAYAAYPGYRAGAGALGEYNGKFMSGQLVLRGGSCATPPGHVRATYRNFFPPGARWQFSGVRLARDVR